MGVSVGVCSRFSWVRPRLGRIPLSRTPFHRTPFHRTPPFLFKRHIAFACCRRWQSVFCILVSRGFLATQGMEFDSSVRWLAPGIAGSATTGGEVAQGIEAPASGTYEARTDHQSISCEGAQFGGSVGSIGARRIDHEGGGRGSSETCERGMCCHARGSGHQSRRRARSGCQAGESPRSDGGFRGSRGHQFEDSFEASTEGCTGIARGSPDPRAGGFHRKGTQENCQDRRRQGCPRCGVWKKPRES